MTIYDYILCIYFVLVAGFVGLYLGITYKTSREEWEELKANWWDI